MTSYIERITALKQELTAATGSGKNTAQCCSEEALEAFHRTTTYICKDSKDYVGDLEIAFREALAVQLADSTILLEHPSSPTWQLLEFAVEFAKLFSRSFPLQRIPFKMLEDLLEAQTIATAESIWPYVEKLARNVSHPDLFARGNFMVLKMCNSLLKKLSKSCNTEFCGRVLMFLAAIYPIAEKSAVNLTGKINSSNVTYFDEITNYGVTSTGGASNSVAPGAGAETAVKSEETAVPMETDAAPAGVKKEKGDEAHVKEEVALDPTSMMMGDISYAMYQSFWKLQSFFASESKVIDSAEVWRSFVTHCRQVMKLFDLKGMSDQELWQARQTMLKKQRQKTAKQQQVTRGEQDKDEVHNYLGCKYLTSSQLFSLQLRDPVLRQQVAVQVLYFVHYLRVKEKPFTDPELLAEVAADMLELHNQAQKLIERTPAEGPKLAGVVKRLLSREKHWIEWKNAGCRDFVRAAPAAALAPLCTPLAAGAAATPPPVGAEKVTSSGTGGGGGAAADTTSSDSKKTADEDKKKAAAKDAVEARKLQVLKRKLQELDKPSSRTFDQFKRRSGASSSAAKSPTGMGSAAGAGAGARGGEGLLVDGEELSELCAAYLFDTSLAHVQQIAADLRDDIPAYETKVAEYYDAEDPESGIDDEYHPKHDDLYCWRVRRLLAAKHLRGFESMPDGDLSKGLKRLRNSADVTEKDEDEEEDKEVCDDEEEETGAAAAATGVKVKENDEKTSHQPEGRVEAVDFGSEEAKDPVGDKMQVENSMECAPARAVAVAGGKGHNGAAFAAKSTGSRASTSGASSSAAARKSPSGGGAAAPSSRRVTAAAASSHMEDGEAEEGEELE